jgi:hypothetical protein
MTRDIDIVIALLLKDLEILPSVFGEEFYFSKEDLILSKLDWARDSQSQRQLSDVENLLATGADLNYLQTWSQKLNLTDMLTRVSP